MRLEPPRAARAPVTFYLSAPQPADVTIPEDTEVATVRTETSPAIVFSTGAGPRSARRGSSGRSRGTSSGGAKANGQSTTSARSICRGAIPVSQRTRTRRRLLPSLQGPI